MPARRQQTQLSSPSGPAPLETGRPPESLQLIGFNGSRVSISRRALGPGLLLVLRHAPALRVTYYCWNMTPPLAHVHASTARGVDAKIHREVQYEQGVFGSPSVYPLVQRKICLASSSRTWSGQKCRVRPIRAKSALASSRTAFKTSGAMEQSVQPCGGLAIPTIAFRQRRNSSNAADETRRAEVRALAWPAPQRNAGAAPFPPSYLERLNAQARAAPALPLPSHCMH